MTNINQIHNGAFSAGRINRLIEPTPSARLQPTHTNGTRRTDADSVNLSPEARFLEQLRENSVVRHDLIQSVRAQIADGTYETPERIDRAVSALIDDAQS